MVIKKKIKENTGGIKGRIRVIVTKAGTDEILRALDLGENLVMNGVNTGKNLIAQRLAGTNTFSLNITHADIGTGTATPAESDTALQTPTVRAAKSSESVVGKVVTFRFFFSDALLPNGTYNEFGCFVDGESAVSTGKIFNRSLFSLPYTKSTSEDSTFEVEITVG